MQSTDVAVIGGGQAGLAMSRCLTGHDLGHVVFERGEVAERWTTRTWNSLRLLTPNWLNTLPGLPYDGDDPEGFMACGEFAARLRSYAAGCPVLANTEVVSVERHGRDFLLTTSAGPWRAAAVVVATGHCDIPSLPGALAVGGQVVALHASNYRSPASLPPGKILVVGASASGVQIADELLGSGREVVLSVGRHTRLPRTWRGTDIHRWLRRTGMLSQRTAELPNPESAMREPAPQLAGRPDRAEVDLAALQARGVRLAGRLTASENGIVTFADDLAASVAQADARQQRVLGQIDLWARLGPAGPEISTVDVSRPAPRRLALADEGVGTIVWATGYRRRYGWLKLPVHDGDGELVHRDGALPVPGLYALGLRLLRKRDSHFIGGAGTDAAAIAGEISTFLRNRDRRAA